MISDAEGELLVNLARQAVTTYLSDSTVIESSERIDARAGVFVTLNYLDRNKEEHLRGCIGFPLPDKTLYESVIDAAIAAATEDPRFPPVDSLELRNLIFEVSVLTPPVELIGRNIEQTIQIGRDGLILRSKYGSGLLLPQVPVELKWSTKDFLTNLCYKAGTTPDALRDPNSKLFSFQAIVFRELQPAGKVARWQF